MDTAPQSKDSYDQVLQFSRITRENWLSPDRKNYVPFGVTSEQWIQRFLEPRLATNVPTEVVKVFEVARGAMIYSWFFYPLATLGFEQCTRIVEFAVWERCRMIQRPSDNFADNLRKLIATGVISTAAESRWQNLRMLRNDRSHLRNFMLLDPFQAADLLHNMAELISELFSSPTNA